MNLRRCAAIFFLGMVLLIAACSATSEPRGTGGAGGAGGQDIDAGGSGGTMPLSGCANWSNWTCNPPPPGNEYYCLAVCPPSNAITCNQQTNECHIGHGDGTTVSCPAPTGSGCDICKNAAEGCLKGEIIP